ncbi:MAG TPA: TasA family protein [Arthrobacter sp.]
MRISLKTTSGKVLASAALLGSAAAVAGLGTFGSFTATTEATTNVTAGITRIDVNGNGGWNNMNIAAAGLMPGDRVERLITLSNSGDQDLMAMSLTTTEKAAAPSPLTTDKTNGLQLTVENCPVAWAGTVGAYTCSAPVTVLPARSIIGANTVLPSLASLKAKGTDNLKVSVALPVSADNTFQGLGSSVGFGFAATERAAIVK